MVEGARLESVYTSKGYRGFESRTLRTKTPELQIAVPAFCFGKFLGICCPVVV